MLRTRKNLCVLALAAGKKVIKGNCCGLCGRRRKIEIDPTGKKQAAAPISAKTQLFGKGS